MLKFSKKSVFHLVELVRLGNTEVIRVVGGSFGVAVADRATLQGSNERTDHLGQLHKFITGVILGLFGEDAGA